MPLIHKDRPKTLPGTTDAISTPCGKLYLTLNHDEEGNLMEIIMRIGKSGNCVRIAFEVIAIAFSVLLQSGVGKDRLREIIKKHFKGVNCGQIIKDEGEEYTGCIDYVACKILDYEEKSEKKKEPEVK